MSESTYDQTVTLFLQIINLCCTLRLRGVAESEASRLVALFHLAISNIPVATLSIYICTSGKQPFFIKNGSCLSLKAGW